MRTSTEDWQHDLTPSRWPPERALGAGDLSKALADLGIQVGRSFGKVAASAGTHMMKGFEPMLSVLDELATIVCEVDKPTMKIYPDSYSHLDKYRVPQVTIQNLDRSKRPYRR